MKTIRILTTPLLLSAALLVNTGHAQEERIYHERFINLTGSFNPHEDYGWSCLAYAPMHADPDVLVDNSGNSISAVASIMNHKMGFETCFCDDDLGYLEQWANGSEAWFVSLDEEFFLDRTQMEITRIKWLDLSGLVDQPFDHETRVVVRIDGQLYASAANYDVQEGASDRNWTEAEHTFTTAGSDWLHLSAEVGQILELGDPLEGDLPSGDITGVGFYFYLPPVSPHESIRIDEFEIFAEPSEGGGSDDSWAGYTIVKQGEQDWVDTTGWVGWLDVTASPWIYSLSLDGWVFVEESAAAADAGAWMYVLK